SSRSPVEPVSDKNRIQNLACTFPSLRNAPGVAGQWDALALDNWAATVASSGETHSARFVLGVWNRYEEWQCGRFDLIHALGDWDQRHVEAIMRWMEQPWFV